MPLTSAAGRLTAVLGPTNTGKTYLAIERMLGHEFGHDRLPAAPAGARELRSHRQGQGRLAGGADHRRGEDRPARRALFRLHRRIHAARPYRCRSSPSTRCRWRPIPSAAISSPTGSSTHAARTKPCCWAPTPSGRCSIACCPTSTSWRGRASPSSPMSGPKKATRLPRRSAVVGFSASEVYAIAELIRRQRGGTAIVMGALEPAHAQRPGRHVPVGRGRLPGGDRCHRHGPQHGREPRLVRLVAQI